MKNIDLFDNYYDDNSLSSLEYPKVVCWKNPEDGQSRNRLLRDKSESDSFFDWFLKKYPDIKYSIE